MLNIFYYSKLLMKENSQIFSKVYLEEEFLILLELLSELIAKLDNAPTFFDKFRSIQMSIYRATFRILVK